MNQVNEIVLSYDPIIDRTITITNSRESANAFRPFFKNISLNEESAAMFLNNNQNIIGIRMFSAGDLSRCIIDLSLICSTALLTRSAMVILCHSHPSGTLQLSEPDIKVTKMIKDGLALFDIKLLDHIILTKDDFTSFADKGLM